MVGAVRDSETRLLVGRGRAGVTSERDHRIAEALDLMIREARAAGEEAAS